MPFWGRSGGDLLSRPGHSARAVRSLLPQQRARRTVPYQFGIRFKKPERFWNLGPIRALRERGGLARKDGDRLWGQPVAISWRRRLVRSGLRLSENRPHHRALP